VVTSAASASALIRAKAALGIPERFKSLEKKIKRAAEKMAGGTMLQPVAEKLL
jgi:hypothetical protein